MSKAAEGQHAAEQREDAIAKAMAFDAKYARGNPVTARELAKLEAKAIKTGQSPKSRSRAGTRVRRRPRRPSS